MTTLVLSLFPGIGLLDMAFEAEGFCVVRGPDLLWGGDIKRFHPPAGRFDGVIGGDPCQAHSQLVHMVRANGHEVAEDLTPELTRVIEEGQPEWFLRENVPHAPDPTPRGYRMHVQELCDHWCGGRTSRRRRIWFGTRDGRTLPVETLALHTTQPELTVTRDARRRPVQVGGSGRPKRGGCLPHEGATLAVSEMARLQGYPEDFLASTAIPLTTTGKRSVIGNGVPKDMGRAIAKAVRRALELQEQAA
jgi:DNA (cytosine-5)-methyltransferase 1